VIIPLTNCITIVIENLFIRYLIIDQLKITHTDKIMHWFKPATVKRN